MGIWPVPPVCSSILAAAGMPPALRVGALCRDPLRGPHLCPEGSQGLADRSTCARRPLRSLPGQDRGVVGLIQVLGCCLQTWAFYVLRDVGCIPGLPPAG